MTILEQMQSFASRYRKEITVGNITWRYYRLGKGAPLFWLTGGLRRAALGFAFMEGISKHHTIVAPDYPPVQTVDEMVSAFDAILQAEGIDTFSLGGQSYGGFLAQIYLAHRPKAVERLVLSSTAPADYGKAALPVEYAFIALARLVPEKILKNLLVGGLLKLVTVPDAERAEWQETILAVRDELTRDDVMSHFAVAADLIRKGIVTPASYRNWKGRVVVLSADNDPTQSAKDIPRYEKLFGRPVDVVNMGHMGHTAMLFNPGRYIEIFERELV